MESATVARERERADGKAVTHINVGGIRYLPLAPAGELRSAIREYGEARPAPRCETLNYLVSHSSVELSRGDWEGVLRAAVEAAVDPRLSPESRSTFRHVRDVLAHAVP